MRLTRAGRLLLTAIWVASVSPLSSLAAEATGPQYHCSLLDKDYPFVGMTFDIKSDEPLISSVTPESPALKSGIRPGDIIVAYDEVTIKTYHEIIAAIGKRAIGDSLKLTVIREGATQQFEVTIDRKPLGYTYIDCALSVRESNSNEARVYWLTKSAELGYINAMMMLGEIYTREQPQNHQEAIKWFRAAADLGDANAQLVLGMYYYDVDLNREEAAKWFRLAAGQGSVDAQITLGLMYSTGDGVARDYAEAVKWVQLAADQGLPKAKCTLGVMFNYGLGVTKDPAKAFKLFEEAAGAGDANAKYHLALFYSDGRVVRQNRTKAAELLTEAANGGSLEAQALRDSLER